MPRTLDDLDDDLNLPQRSHRPDARDEMVRDLSHESDKEFTLSTGTVLVLFFTLALICAVFFGFGYSIGRKSVKAPETAALGPADTTATQDDAPGKPAAGAPAAAIPSYQADTTSPARTNSPVSPAKITASADGSRVVVTTQPPISATKPSAGTPAAVTAPSTDAAAPKVQPAATEPQATPSVAVAGDPNSVYVQIAAVSHQEDANVLLSALKRRGYSVFTRSSPGDKLIHVQVGPYSGKKDAEVMRQRLLGDGYNAILK